MSAMVANRDVMDVYGPGQHGSTFGGNPLASAVGREVVAMMAEGTWQQRSRELGEHLAGALSKLDSSKVKELRVRGLWAGVELSANAPSARTVCERMADAGVLCKETHETTVRLAPPLVITEEQLDHAVAVLAKAME